MNNMNSQKNRIINKVRKSSGTNKVSDFGKSKSNQPPPPGSNNSTSMQTPKKKKDCGCRRKKRKG